MLWHRKCGFKFPTQAEKALFCNNNPFTTQYRAPVSSNYSMFSISCQWYWSIFTPLFLTHARHKWQKIRAVQMYIEHLILPLPDNDEVMKGAFRFWKVRGCMELYVWSSLQEIDVLRFGTSNACSHVILDASIARDSAYPVWHGVHSMYIPFHCWFSSWSVFQVSKPKKV